MDPGRPRPGRLGQARAGQPEPRPRDGPARPQPRGGRPSTGRPAPADTCTASPDSRAGRGRPAAAAHPGAGRAAAGGAGVVAAPQGRGPRDPVHLPGQAPALLPGRPGRDHHRRRASHPAPGRASTRAADPRPADTPPSAGVRRLAPAGCGRSASRHWLSAPNQASIPTTPSPRPARRREGKIDVVRREIRPQLVAGPLLARRRHPRLPPRLPHPQSRRGQGPRDRLRPPPRRFHRPRRRHPVAGRLDRHLVRRARRRPGHPGPVPQPDPHPHPAPLGHHRAQRHQRHRGQRVGQEAPRPATPPPPSPPSSRSCR